MFTRLPDQIRKAPALYTMLVLMVAATFISVPASGKEATADTVTGTFTGMALNVGCIPREEITLRERDTEKVLADIELRGTQIIEAMMNGLTAKRLDGGARLTFTDLLLGKQKTDFVLWVPVNRSKVLIQSGRHGIATTVNGKTVVAGPDQIGQLIRWGVGSPINGGGGGIAHH